MSDRVVVCVGTKKGLFVLEGAPARRKFDLRGPFFGGNGVNAALVDTRGTPRIYAAPSSPFFGTTIQRSTDLGRKWKQAKGVPTFPEGDGRALKNIWSLAPGEGKRTLLCGVEPAALFRSDDSGDTWSKVAAISDHAHARTWQPGNGGLCLHTILKQGGRLHLGISTGGHYVSGDGAASFAPQNRGVKAVFMPDVNPEYGQCVHKIAAHPKTPDRLYMQNHGGDPNHPDAGVLRSDDAGKSWRPITKGLPGDFGFPIVVHPHAPDTVYVVPLEPMTRACPDAAPAVWRSEDGGGSWQRRREGLPKKDAWFTVLRDGMDMDDLPKPALWFGTTTGQLWIGRDGGERFECLYDSLPPIHMVKVAVV